MTRLAPFLATAGGLALAGAVRQFRSVPAQVAFTDVAMALALVAAAAVPLLRWPALMAGLVWQVGWLAGQAAAPGPVTAGAGWKVLVAFLLLAGAAAAAREARREARWNGSPAMLEW